MLKLNTSHIDYVMGCMRSNTTKIRNIKKDLLTARFNAPTTIGSYFGQKFITTCLNTQERDREDFMKMLARIAFIPFIIVKGLWE